MLTHDPLKNVHALRDHLAADDKPIAFFFGAGTSCAVKSVGCGPDGPKADDPLIPAVRELTLECERAVSNLGGIFDAAWKAVEQECSAETEEPNVENILSRVRRKLDAVGESDILMGLAKGDLEKMEKAITTTIAKLAKPPDDCLPVSMPHQDLARWIARIPRQQPVETFTTNYDILIERALEGERCPFFDGFVGSVRPYFYLADKSLPPWTRLWKIHGSINWASQSYGDQERIVRVEPSLSGEMILPSHRKYDESRKQPYAALLERLGQFLGQEDAIMVAVGHSFGDQHINSVIFEALDRSRRSQVIALTFDDFPDTHNLVLTAKRQAKLSVFGPETAVIGGQQGEWRLLEYIDERTAAFMDIAFDSDAAPEEDSASVTGRMVLGDFNRFCKFLAAMEV